MAAKLVAPPDRVGQSLSAVPRWSVSAGSSRQFERRVHTGEDLDKALAEKRVKKLTAVEPQRILVVLDECLKNLRLCLFLPGDVSDNLTRLSVQLGSDLFDQIQRHNHILQNYEELIENYDEDDEESDSEIAMAGQSVRASLRELLRLFRANPRALSAVEAEIAKNKLAAESGKLMGEMRQVRANVFEKLSTTKKEENDRIRHLDSLRQRQERRDADIAQLEETLQRAKSDMQAKLNAKNEIAAILEGKIANVEKRHQAATASIATDASKKLETLQEQSEEAFLKAKIKEAQEQLNKSMRQDYDAEHKSRKRKFRIETEVENWIQKYDEDMTERQDKLEEMQAAYDEEKAQLEDLEGRFAKLEVEYNSIMLERQQTKEREEKMARELKIQVSAAVKLQYLWRKVMQRRAFNKKNKKKKGKKGKGSGRKGSSRKGSSRKSSGKKKKKT